MTLQQIAGGLALRLHVFVHSLLQLVGRQFATQLLAHQVGAVEDMFARESL